MQYADLTVGRTIRNTVTYESAEIRALANQHGLIEIEVISNEYGEQGITDYLSPAEILTFWVRTA